MQASHSEFLAAEKQYARSASQLRAIADRQSRKWSASKRARYQHDLQVLERALARTRAAASMAATDPRTQELLYATYRQQIKYLQDSILGSVSVSRAAAVPRGAPVMPAAHAP